MSYPKQQFFAYQPAQAVIRSPLVQAIDQNSVGGCEELILADQTQVHEVVSADFIKQKLF